MASEESEFDRQQQIWAGLYGPPTAAELIDKARQHYGAHPEMEIRAVFQAVEPFDDDDDSDEAGLARPGVG